MITASQLVELAKYFTTIHHTDGRIRLRISPKIRDIKGSISLKDIEDLSSKIDGIKNIKINKIIGSITINYDGNIFEKKIWDNLIDGIEVEKTTSIINKLYKEII